MQKQEVKPGTLVKHYKHDPAKDKNEYTYEIVGVAKHTETEEMVVVYRPLYNSPKFEGVELFVRPLDMFCERIEWEGKVVERFEVLE